jgi:hypothetical protein
MPTSGRLTSYNSAVATLLSHAGIAVNMNYGPTASGCQLNSIVPALRNHFRYSTENVAHRAGFSDAAWIAKIKSDLNARRPIWYAGTGTSGGHAFVLDGYTDSNFFHFNWGWNGAYDGYFILSNLRPGGQDFTTTQHAVFGIRPVSSQSLAAPSNVTAGAASRNRINLAWRDNSRDEQGFRIERQIGTAAWSEIAVVAANTTRFTDRGLTPNTRYRYRLRAFNSAGTSAYATSSVVTTPR